MTRTLESMRVGQQPSLPFSVESWADDGGSCAGCGAVLVDYLGPKVPHVLFVNRCPGFPDAHSLGFCRPCWAKFVGKP